ncbi:MAG: putative selenate ABC transporter substrate-binding protein [Chloroflexota bacterium]|nr:putative selenate ABC transporter substrate-binding protein [Dehalococcoidia bacterium]MDW8252862.1 putative selenate ABC transporter substrate-binding protein [Chloroflexota bacterium]
MWARPFVTVGFVLILLSLACLPQPTAGGAPSVASPAQTRPLVIGGIPDQAPATLARSFEGFAKLLSERTGLPVKYQPAQDYAAIVAAFRRGEVHLVWFGGLTGVQAREAVPGARAVAHRPIDAEFRSVFIVHADSKAERLTDLRGMTFTFGSESSTSGHLMPRYFLLEAGIDPDRDFRGKPNFSGAHDRTYKLVEAGSFQAGALNMAVWDAAVRNGQVDTTKVREFYRTPPYFDYNWTIHPDVDKIWGAGASEKLIQALLSIRASDGPEAKEILDLFATDRFVPTQNSNYEAIRRVAEQLGILR